MNEISEVFWDAIKPNITTLADAKIWWQVCNEFSSPEIDETDKEFIKMAANLLPQGELTQETWGQWTKILKLESARSGKSLFMPLRIAITGMTEGPELNNLLPLIGREEVIKRLNLSAD